MGTILVVDDLAHNHRLMSFVLENHGYADAESYEPPDLDDIPNGGMGIFLIRKLMDDVTYTRVSGRNHWSLTKSLLVKGI
ncbi:ATP-binding protein [Candidatus Chloroploca sp. M-50]|uniref:ATP-binding protein n=1 Tax=Candidatus Chloroploca mongolica TaxID=2528176 RepID=A0ABS4DBQ1_9CHLR|nr:ATP-binding protein [Candidatus Chloroploca mongolica]MBP1466876.1 ATP-binding protein [Candidatus Chloroploca mongolica]